MSFDDALTRANFSFVYFLQFCLLKFFGHFSMGGGLNPQIPPLATRLGHEWVYVCPRPHAYTIARTRK